MKKNAKVSEKLVSPGLPGLQVATRLILVDDLWHKLCNFLSKYLVSIYFSQSTLLTSFPAVMGGFKVLDGRGEEMGLGRTRQQEYLL